MPWLTGDEIPTDFFCRVIRVPNDPAFIQALSGALLDLTYEYNWEKLGDINPGAMADAFDLAYIEFTKSKCEMTPVGATVLWHTNDIPDRWLRCHGQAVLVADYPALFDLWGYKYGASGTQFGIIDMEDLIPMGAGGTVGLDGLVGEATHVLTVNEMPSHNHALIRPGGPSGSYVNVAISSLSTPVNIASVTQNTGSNQPHNNIPPVRGAHWIVYAGEL